MITGTKSIVTRGMEMHWDVASIKSFEPSNTGSIIDIYNGYDMTNRPSDYSILYDETDGIKSLHRTVKNVTDDYSLSEAIDLQGDFTFDIWTYAIEGGTSANGVMTNHNHSNNTGAGINYRWLSSTDYRLGCSTGNGTTRTYTTYYGDTNIYQRWAYCVLRFIKATNTFSLWVDGVKDKEFVYAQVNTSQGVGLFRWSVPYLTTSYRVRGKIAKASVYSVALTDEEIVQNYNATKTRFNK